MKKVYLVHGSEDGVLGVFSSRKRALAEAIRYVEQSGATSAIDTSYGDLITYVTQANGSHFGTAYVETFWLE